MSRKYRQAFKETLCRCILSNDERHILRDGRGRIYSERSATYITATGGNVTTKLLSDKSDSSHNKGSVSPHRNVYKDLPEQQNACQRKWALWKTHMLYRHKKGDKKMNGCDNTNKGAPNGSVCTDSNQSSSSSLPAQHIKEELELTDMVLPTIEVSEHEVILPKESKDRLSTGGTFL